MAVTSDISSSGILDLPDTTSEHLARGVSPRGTLEWVREAVVEGDRINRSDPSYDGIEYGQQYISGWQRANAPDRPAYLGKLFLNESRRVAQAHKSALTDLRPVWAYKATNPAFTAQADLINKLTLAWWITTMADRPLGETIVYSLAGGTGDTIVEWDPMMNFGQGDVRLSARDPRDTLPWRPPLHDKSVQAWEGLVLRESHTVNVMRGLFPDHAHLFKPTTDSLMSTWMGRFRTTVTRLLSPAADTLSGLDQPAIQNKVRSGDILLYRTYLTDRSKNLTGKPIPMGKPGSSWAYVVKPGDYLYPYKRLIVSTPETILYDGPSTYWHGQYPVSRLMLWSVPWQFLGIGLLNDLRPLQDGINKTAQDIDLAIDQWLNPQTMHNRGAVSESFMRTYDPRRPGVKIKLNEVGVKEGFKRVEGPPPQIMALAFQYLEWKRTRFGDLSGTPNMTELLALRQLPGADTIQRYWEALTPELRQEGREVESYLRTIADQQKSMRFQYESNARRVTILGDAGQLLEDFDYDPGNLVPAMREGDPGYQKEFDEGQPRDVRARAFQNTIIFTLAPNSLLAVNATEQKMIRLQLARGGMYDFWSLLESLEIPNIGQPPPIPLPPIDPTKAQQEYIAILQQIQQLMMTAGANPQAQLQAQQLQQALAAKYVIDPVSGQLLEVRSPMTVTERLMAQNHLGIGMTESPAGRKATGQAPPQMEQKSDGRTTVTESRHDKGEGSQ